MLYNIFNLLGNPTSYRGYKLSWQGRRLIRFDNVEYTYDADGIRTSKRDSNKQIKFYTDSNTIVAEEIFVAGSAVTERHYFYGTDGIAGFRQEGVTYLFRKNVQGDVTHIYTESGKLVGQYAYDAWGNCKILVDIDGVASVNPFRYRGYDFDYETGLYYLQTRYYDPQTCRFISADSIEYLDPETLGGLNLYAYCGNNPVMGYDPNGNLDWGAIGRFLGGLVLTIVGACISLSTIIPAIESPLATLFCEFGLTVGMYGAYMLGSVFDKDIKNDMDLIHWNPYNLDENAVTQSTKVSFYKGVPVIRYTSGRSGTFGIMFLKNTANAQSVKHEFGHVPQLILMGIERFAFVFGIPSAEKIAEKKYGYYNQPWETSADMFGGLSNQHTEEEKQRAIWYLVLAHFFGPLALLLIL